MPNRGNAPDPAAGDARTKKLHARFGERLIRVRYLYDTASGRRFKTVKLIVEGKDWHPSARRPRRAVDDIVPVRIGWQEMELRARAKALGGVWRPAAKVWELRWDAVRRLGITDRVVEGNLDSPRVREGKVDQS